MAIDIARQGQLEEKEKRRKGEKEKTMGSTYWSDDRYRERASFLRRAGKGAFEFHDANMRRPERGARFMKK